MSQTCTRCNGEKKIWKWDLLDMSNLSNGYWRTCARCSGSGEIAEDASDDDDDDE
jgi:hypothetical protein